MKKIRVIMEADGNLLHAIGKHDRQGITFTDALKLAEQKIKARKEQKNKTDDVGADVKMPTAVNANRSSNPQPSK